MAPMPAVFIGHGSPMNAFEDNRYTQAWRDFAHSIPRPRAIVAVSAHWYINASAVTAMARPRTIHDFFGFGDDLNSFQYPAPGSPELAGEVAAIVDPIWIGMDIDSWGLDHGTWSVLTHMFPDADIPVVQLSVDASKRPQYHVDLGAALAPLRDDGVLVLASGNVVHHLGRLDFDQPDSGYDWAHTFDDLACHLMEDQPGDIAALVEHRLYADAAPTPDHLLPLFYVAGLAAAGGRAEALIRGYAYGSLSMSSYVVR